MYKHRCDDSTWKIYHGGGGRVSAKEKLENLRPRSSRAPKRNAMKAKQFLRPWPKCHFKRAVKKEMRGLIHLTHNGTIYLWATVKCCPFRGGPERA